MVLRSKVAAAAGAAALTALTVGGVAPAQAASGFGGCPSKFVCVMDGSRIIVKWSSYGAHNLNNITGTHRLVNAQTGGAKAYVCRGYNGNDCGGYRWVITKYHYVPAQSSDESLNFTPINSIYLAP